MPRLFVLAAAFLALAGCGRAPASRVAVDEAWVRLPAAEGVPGAAYFVLHGGPKDTALVAVDSPMAERIELHETMSGGGMSHMNALARVDLSAGGTVAFQPGGRHAMLFGISKAAAPFTFIPLSFRFADGTVVRSKAFVVAAGDPQPRFVPAPKPAEPAAPCKSGMVRKGDEIVVRNCGD